MTSLIDPSAEQCRIFDTFSNPVQPTIIRPISFSTSPVSLTSNLRSENISNLPARYCNVENYSRLVETKNTFSTLSPNEQENSRFLREAVQATNPFENIGNSIFGNRAAIKLANIDAVFNLTQMGFGLTQYRYNQRFRFVDLAGGPGAFSEYLQFRQAGSNGIGITLKGPNDWDRTRLDVNRYQFEYGLGGTGDLYLEWKSLINVGFITPQSNSQYGIQSLDKNKGNSPFDENPIGAHLVVADGGFDIEKNFERQEFLTMHLILIECYLALRFLMKDGSFVCKFYSTVTELSAEILYLLSQCFDSITLFKPVSSRPANEEQYLVCQGFRNNAEKYFPIWETAANRVTEIATSNSNERITKILNELSPEFITWLTNSNNLMIERQQEAANNILQYVSTRTSPEQQYDLHKFLIIWNLPDNLSRETNIKSKVPYRGQNNSRPLQREYQSYQSTRSIPTHKVRLIYRKSSREQSFPYMRLFLPPIENMIDYLRRGSGPGPNVKYSSENSFDNKNYPIIQTNVDDYYLGNAIANYFTEDVRIKCTRNNRQSPLEIFLSGRIDPNTINVSPTLSGNLRNLDLFRQREAIYQTTAECNNFNVSLGIFIIRLLKGRRVLDPSSGWGDRAIASIISNVEQYLGFDPNKALADGYRQIEDLATNLGINCKFVLEPFDLINIKQITGRFDLIFTSPPYFDLENYDPTGIDQMQSIARYSTYPEWVNGFLYPYLEKAWQLLEINGNFAIYVENVRNLKITDDVYNFFSRKSTNFRGIIGFQYENSRNIRLTYVWQKTN